MGIIAGIAVPVTIAVINRQKKNAAAKSAEAVVATIKQYVNEFLADADTQIIITLGYGTTTASNKPAEGTKQVDSANAASFTATELAEFAVENLKAKGTIKAKYTLSDAKYDFTGSSLVVSDYNISIDPSGSCTATSKAGSSSSTTPTTQSN